MNNVIKLFATLTVGVALYSGAEPLPPIDSAVVIKPTLCTQFNGCPKLDQRATTPNGEVFRVSQAEAAQLGTDRNTFIGLGVQLRTDIEQEPQPVSIPVRSSDSAVGTEVVFFEYVGVQVGPQAIDVFGNSTGHTQIQTDRMVGDLFVAVPSPEDNWRPDSQLDYDERFGKAVGYILRYHLRGQLHTVGKLIVASDDDNQHDALSIGSIPPKWSEQLRLNPDQADQQMHFVLSAPQSHGFNPSDCNGAAICENFCAAAVPWEIEQCGSACCASGGGGGPAVNQCNDGLDNDGDGDTDGLDSECGHSPLCDSGGPAHTHRYESGFNFMMTAKTTFCSDETDPFGQLWERAGYTKQAFRAGTGDGAFDSWKLTNDNVARPVAVKCWTFSDPEDAVDCDINGNCGPFHAGSNNPYPFAQKSVSTELFSAAIDDLHHSAGVGLKQPVSLIQVVANSFETAEGGSGSGSADQPGRASVVLSSSTNSTSAHEFGHSAGLDHCNADTVNGQWTLMASNFDDDCPGVGSHQRDHFGPTNGATLHQCLKDSCIVDPSF